MHNMMILAVKIFQFYDCKLTYGRCIIAGRIRCEGGLRNTPSIAALHLRHSLKRSFTHRGEHDNIRGVQ